MKTRVPNEPGPKRNPGAPFLASFARSGAFRDYPEFAFPNPSALQTYNAAENRTDPLMPESPAPNRLSTRITIASLTFAACCLLSSARLIIDAPNPKNAPGNIARGSDQRFPALRSALPERGVVGYIGDPGTPALADYYLAQYALAPLVVDHSTTHSLVVGNFPASAPTSARMTASSGDLHPIKDFGDGVLLFAGQAAGKDSK